MRKLLLFVPSFILITSCSGDPATEKENSASSTATNPAAVEITEGTTEEVAKMVADFIIANDNQGLMNMIITPEEMKEVIANSTVMQQGKEVAIANIPQQIAKMKTDFTNGMADIRKQCEASGVEWSNCKFKDVTTEIASPNGYQMAQLVCVMECNGMEYKFSVSDVVQTRNNEWKLGGTLYYGDVPPQNPGLIPVKK